MKAVMVGLLLLPALALTVLSMRPGGLRRQLRFAVRRLKLAFVLGGIYVAVSTAARLLLGDGERLDWVLAGVALALAVTFVVLAQDPAPERQRP